jgi:hypothetical protein
MAPIPLLVRIDLDAMSGRMVASEARCFLSTLVLARVLRVVCVETGGGAISGRPAPTGLPQKYLIGWHDRRENLGAGALHMLQ